MGQVGHLAEGGAPHGGGLRGAERQRRCCGGGAEPELEKTAAAKVGALQGGAGVGWAHGDLLRYKEPG
jgi:hypothetical protein